MAAEGSGQSRFGRLFWEFGPERTLLRFAQVLEAAHRAGELQVPDPRRAASHFFVLLKGEHHIKSLVGAASSPDAAERQRHVEDGGRRGGARRWRGRANSPATRCCSPATRCALPATRCAPVTSRRPSVPSSSRSTAFSSW